MRVNATCEIPERELRFRFARSGGPGGQNVNKVATKAVLYFDVGRSKSLPEDVRARFLARYAGRIKDGVAQIASDEHRTQLQNRVACEQRLVAMLNAVWRAPAVRKATRPSRAAKARRREGKQAQSARKASRRWRPDEAE